MFEAASMEQNKTIVIGTRASALALYQAEQVRISIQTIFPHIMVEIKKISTRGDEIQHIALSKIGDKGLFTAEIEDALLNGSIDMAVHSLKDMPTELDKSFCIGAVLPRGECRDALVSLNKKKLADLTPSDRIATSSLRRKAGILHLYPDLHIIDIRGNVQSRIKKMETGYCDAMIMATAGLQRMNLEHYITEILEPVSILPAVSQGIIAIETLSSNDRIRPVTDEINHAATWQCAKAERAFMHSLMGGCQVPVGCFSQLTEDVLCLTGSIASVDGRQYLTDSISGSIHDALRMGSTLANRLLDQGGRAILDTIRKEQNNF